MEAYNWQHAGLEYFYWMYKNKSPETELSIGTYMFCV